jgi:hypothetical protein
MSTSQRQEGTPSGASHGGATLGGTTAWISLQGQDDDGGYLLLHRTVMTVQGEDATEIIRCFLEQFPPSVHVKGEGRVVLAASGASDLARQKRKAAARNPPIGRRSTSSSRCGPSRSKQRRRKACCLSHSQP